MKLNSKINNEKEEKLKSLNEEEKNTYKLTNIIIKETIAVVIILAIFSGLIIKLDLASTGMWSGLITVLLIYVLVFLSVPLILFLLGLRKFKKGLLNKDDKMLKRAKILETLSLTFHIIYILYIGSSQPNLQGASNLLIAFLVYIPVLVAPNTAHLIVCFSLKNTKI